MRANRCTTPWPRPDAPAIRPTIQDSRRLPGCPESVQRDNKSTTIRRFEAVPGRPVQRLASPGLVWTFPQPRASSRERDNREPRCRPSALRVTPNIARS
ncbi:hypothetical protein PSAB6_410148 [Paraburkholderia sabiae]|nr:hypothetical protein PSAB6_410148 [Paraburkholderia sabiae]